MSNDKFNLDGFSVDESNNVTTTGNISSPGGAISTTGQIAGGEVYGAILKIDNKSYGSDGQIDESKSVHLMNAAFVTCDLTSTAPVNKALMVFSCSDATQSCTITLASGTWDGTNDIATFSTNSSVTCYGDGARYHILSKEGTVTFS